MSWTANQKRAAFFLTLSTLGLVGSAIGIYEAWVQLHQSVATPAQPPPS